jgi:hypothetical protein
MISEPGTDAHVNPLEHICLEANELVRFLFDNLWPRGGPELANGTHHVALKNQAID